MNYEYVCNEIELEGTDFRHREIKGKSQEDANIKIKLNLKFSVFREEN
ncbi:hypothetical protein [Thiorhodococcus fuscus]|uniref:Uncharacterized protein n=1 Tax=Thiorhodococcus fuscus TaxID=527200 RepID=A0ABW4YAM8_9GAMM